MALATRCPHCATAFRIVPDQLKLRGGWVRCGVCNDVFDAARNLIDVSGTGAPLAAPAPVEPAAPPVPAAVGDAMGDAPAAGPAGSEPAAEAAPAVAPLSAADAAPAFVDLASDGPPLVLRRRGGAADRDPDTLPPLVPPETEAQVSAPDLETPAVFRKPGLPPVHPELAGPPGEQVLPVVPSSSSRREPKAVEQDLLDELASFSADRQPPVATLPPFTAADPPPAGAPAFMDDEARARSRRRQWWWGVAAAVLALVLIGQAAWIFRAEVATRVPLLRPVLEHMCRQWQCTVGYPRAPGLLVIESSSLEPWSVEPSAPATAAPADGENAAPAAEAPQVVLPVRRLALRIVLRNRAAFPQDWPAIELALTDLSDVATARRVLPPSVYLSPDQLAEPIGAGEERTLRIPVETLDAQASGYRVAIFYP